MSYGLLTTGFNRKTYETVIEEMQARAKSLYGNDVNLENTSPLGMFIQLTAYFLASGDTEDPGLWELAEDVYNSGYVDTGEGESLNKAVKYQSLTRRKAEKATGQITITGTNGTVVAAGFLGATTGGIQFATIEAFTIASGTATANIEAVNGGANTNVPAGTITVIVNPTTGVTAITNASTTTGGYDEETDEELRDRYSALKAGASTADSIRATLLQLTGVRDAIVRVNYTNGTVGGIPAKSIAPIVLGGTDANIADAILSTKAAGIQSYGTTEVSATDLSGNIEIIGFTRPTEISIWVNVTLTTNSSFPSDGNAQVKTAIITYIGGQDADAAEYNGLGIDDDVIWAKCISAAMTISGITDITLTLSTDGTTYTAANIAITNLQIARTDSTKVVIA